MNNLLPDERRLQEAEKRMTSGPWRSEAYEGSHESAVIGSLYQIATVSYDTFEHTNAEGIALCRNMAPVLLERIEELAGALRERMEKCLKRVEWDNTGSACGTAPKEHKCDQCKQAARLLEGRGEVNTQAEIEKVLREKLPRLFETSWISDGVKRPPKNMDGWDIMARELAAAVALKEE